MSSLASANSPSSIPSPTYLRKTIVQTKLFCQRTHQWTKALFLYMRSNLWLSLLQAVLMAVVLEIMQTDRGTLARVLSGTVDMGQALIPTLKPAGDHSTN